MAYRLTLNKCPNKTFKPSPIGLLVILYFSVCCANSSSSAGNERYHNHFQYQKQNTATKNYHHHSHHLDRQRNRRNEGTLHHRNVDAKTAFNSINRFYDLSYAYFEDMPVEEEGTPLELMITKQDVGEGVR